MAQSDTLFVDSNFFIALFHQNDSLHDRAMAVAKKLEDEQRRLMITNLVFLEVVTVLSQRKSRAQAIEVGAYLMDDVNITLVHVDERLQAASWDIFVRVPRKNVSFVDCSTVAVMKSEGVASLLSFDITDFRFLQKHYRFSLAFLPILTAPSLPRSSQKGN